MKEGVEKRRVKVDEELRLCRAEITNLYIPEHLLDEPTKDESKKIRNARKKTTHISAPAPHRRTSFGYLLARGLFCVFYPCASISFISPFSIRSTVIYTRCSLDR
jgi:hypothetical protein